MVKAPGGTESAGTLRRLNAPRASEVRAGEDGVPSALRQPVGQASACRDKPWLAVGEVLDSYRTDDRWWTGSPISRMYYELLLEDGRALTVFQDLIGGAWCEQRYR